MSSITWIGFYSFVNSRRNPFLFLYCHLQYSVCLSWFSDGHQNSVAVSQKLKGHTSTLLSGYSRMLCSDFHSHPIGQSWSPWNCKGSSQMRLTAGRVHSVQQNSRELWPRKRKEWRLVASCFRHKQQNHCSAVLYGSDKTILIVEMNVLYMFVTTPLEWGKNERMETSAHTRSVFSANSFPAMI